MMVDQFRVLGIDGDRGLFVTRRLLLLPIDGGVAAVAAAAAAIDERRQHVGSGCGAVEAGQ